MDFDSIALTRLPVTKNATLQLAYATLDGIGKRDLDTSSLCLCHLHLLPQAFDQLVATNLDHGHVSRFDCCTQLESCEGCRVLFLSDIDKAQTIL